MRVRFLHGPRKGEISHCPRSQEIDVLLGAGIIEEVAPDPPAPPTPPEWSVFRTTEFGDLVVLQKRHDGSKSYFNSPPKDCPEHIAKQYAEMRRPGEQPAQVMFGSSTWREKLPI